MKISPSVRLALLTKNCIKYQGFSFIFLFFFYLVFQNNVFAASDREQKITAAGKLRVCIWPDYFSISYKNSKTGQLEGIDIDLSQAFANDLGVGIEYIPTHFGIFMDDIQQDKCDIAMFGVGITTERSKKIDYSEPYLSSGMYGVASKTNPVVDSWESLDHAGVVVCVQKGTYMEGVMRGRHKKCPAYERYKKQPA